MEKFTELLEGLATGVYWLPTYPDFDNQEELFSNAKWKFFYVNGLEIHNEQALLDNFQRVMNSASYCNENLDAFRDCIINIDEDEPNFYRYIILYDNFQAFAEKNDERFKLIVHHIFWDATDIWVRKVPEKRLNILLFGDKAFLPELVTKLDGGS